MRETGIGLDYLIPPIILLSCRQCMTYVMQSSQNIEGILPNNLPQSSPNPKKNNQVLPFGKLQDLASLSVKASNNL